MATAGDIINLMDLSKEQVATLLQKFDTVLCDCDGVLWHDNDVIAGAPAVINKLRAAGKCVRLVTNNSTLTRDAIWQRARTLGYDVAPTDIIAPAHTIAKYLAARDFSKTAYVIGGPSMTEELAAFGISSAGTAPEVIEHGIASFVRDELRTMDVQRYGAVIVSFDADFSYAKLLRACTILHEVEDCLFLATNLDTVLHYPGVHIPGTGPLVHAVQSTIDRPPTLLGKPNPAIMQELRSEGLLQPERTLMIGDCVQVDMQFGRNLGASTLLVGSGHYQLAKVRELAAAGLEPDKLPDYYLPSLGQLDDLLD